MPRKSWAVSSTRSSIVSTWRYQSTAGLTLGVAPGGDDLGDEPVVRLVLGERLPDPAVEGERARPARRSPSVRLFLRIADHFIANRSAYSGRSSRRVDPLRPLLGVGVLLERDDLGRVGQDAADVERRPPGELGVGAGAARLDAQLAELAEDQGIDQVRSTSVRSHAGDSLDERNGRPRDADEPAEPGHDGGLADAVERLDDALAVDDRQVGGVRLILGQPGDVGRRCRRRSGPSTRSCCLPLRGITRRAGSTSSRTSFGSRPGSNGMPWPIQRAIVWYSGEPDRRTAGRRRGGSWPSAS